MAQLIAMRQRIKAIETIKKITHAMRLISMSTHTQLKNKQEALQTYSKSIKDITTLVKQQVPEEPISSPLDNKKADEDLIILVGSEKGLCGNFNNQLFKFFELKKDYYKNPEMIAIGKFAIDYANSKAQTLLQSYKEFNSNNFIVIADHVSNYILEHLQKYKRVIIYSNYPKTFFIQRPQDKQLIPLDAQDNSSENFGEVSDYSTSEKNSYNEYLFEQSSRELYYKLEELHIKMMIQNSLYNSLLAEQAARFISMDSSTRNANDLLTKMKLEYNKERQAAITRELTELVGSFL